MKKDEKMKLNRLRKRIKNLKEQKLFMGVTKEDIEKLQLLMGLGERALSQVALANKILIDENRMFSSPMTGLIADSIVKKRMVREGILASNKTGMKVKNSSSFIYIVKQVNDDGFIKIGKANNVERRVASLQVGSPYKLKIIKIIKANTSSHALLIEKALHRKFKKHKVRGEWYKSCVSECVY